MDGTLKTDHEQGGESNPLIFTETQYFPMYIKAKEMIHLKNLSCPCKNSVNSVLCFILNSISNSENLQFIIKILMFEKLKTHVLVDKNIF